MEMRCIFFLGKKLITPGETRGLLLPCYTCLLLRRNEPFSFQGDAWFLSQGTSFSPVAITPLVTLRGDLGNKEGEKM